MVCCSPGASTPIDHIARSTLDPAASIAEPKAHLHLQVTDLSHAVDFYHAFFGSHPVKLKPGYAKFLPNWAPVNLALSENVHIHAGPVVSHLGIQLTTPTAVQDHLQRVKAAGLSVREEMGVTCCHANLDKFWVRDPMGTEWEVYHLNFDVDENFDGAASSSAYCAR